MMKIFNIVAILVLTFAVSVAPYASINKVAFDFTQNPEESESSSSKSFEDEIYFSKILSFVSEPVKLDQNFSLYIVMKSQLVFTEILKPPLA